MAFLLRDVVDEKLARNEADARLFRSVVQYEFASGLDATAEGAAAAMRRWVKTRPAWVSDIQQARRLAVLAVIEAALSSRTRSIVPVPSGPGQKPDSKRRERLLPAMNSAQVVVPRKRPMFGRGDQPEVSGSSAHHSE